jgi:hypothetical protein
MKFKNWLACFRLHDIHDAKDKLKNKAAVVIACPALAQKSGYVTMAHGDAAHDRRSRSCRSPISQRSAVNINYETEVRRCRVTWQLV